MTEKSYVSSFQVVFRKFEKPFNFKLSLNNACSSEPSYKRTSFQLEKRILKGFKEIKI